METFAMKVRYGSGDCFGPKLEETTGWVSREVPTYNEEMAEVIVKALAETNQHNTTSIHLGHISMSLCLPMLREFSMDSS